MPVWTFMSKFRCENVFISLGNILMTGIAIAHGSLLRNHSTDFQSGWTILHFYRVSAFQLLYMPVNTYHSPVFFIIATLVGVKWPLIVVLICIFLMTNNVEDVFMWLLSICVSFLKNCLFNFLPIFQLDFFFLLLNCESFYFLCLRYKSFTRYRIFKYFVPLRSLPFHLLNSVFWSTEVSNIDEFQLIYFLSLPMISQKQFLNLVMKITHLYFKEFCSFSSWFWVMFTYGMMQRSNFIL